MRPFFLPMTRVPVPNDWNEETDGWIMAVLCVPNSTLWRAVVRGQIRSLAVGWHWDEETGDHRQARDIGKQIFESLDMTCREDIKRIADAMEAANTHLANLADLSNLSRMADIIKACCDKQEQKGQEIDDPPHDGTISVGPGEQFETQSEYFDAKCSVANAIYDTVKETVTWLKNNNVDVLAGGFGGITTGVILAVTTAGPVGWAIIASGAVLGTISAMLVQYAINFQDLEGALIEQHEDCVLALYNSSNAQSAKTNFINALEQSIIPLTPIETGLISAMFPYKMANQLFEPRDDVASYTSPNPIDCGAAIDQLWTFVSDVENWTFQDLSDPSCSASVAHNATNESIEQTLVVASLPNVTAWGQNISPTVAIAVNPGGSIQVDYSATSDTPNNQRVTVRAVYTDTSEYENSIVTNAAGTLILDFTVAGTLERVEVEFSRSTSGSAQGTTHTSDLLEVRVYGG